MVESLEQRIEQLQNELESTKKVRDNLNAFFDGLLQSIELNEKLALLSSIEEIADIGMESLRQVIPFQTCAFLTYNANNDSYEIRRVKNQDGTTILDNVLQEKIMARDMLDWVMESRKPVVLPIDDKEVKNLNTILYLPISSQYSQIGFFIITSDKKEEAFGLEKNHILHMIISLFTMSIENHQLIDAMSEYKNFMKDVMENMINGIITVNSEKQVTFINRNAQFIFNITSSNIINKTYQEVLSSEVSGLFDIIIGEIDEIGSVVDHEFEQKLSDETVLPLGISGSLLINKDRARTGYIITMRDLSLTRELLKLKELDEMKNNFISIVSHELRTPLTSISSYTDALLDGLAETKEDLNNYLKVIKDESTRLISLVNDMLDISKLEAGKMNFNFTDVKINDIIKACVYNIAPVAEKKQQNLVFKEENDLLVRADMDKVTQIIMNLMSNATKFTPENGTIEVQVTEQTGKARIAIKDNGIGIGDDDIDKIFGKFYQVESIKHHQKGTGLGMSICKELVGGHGGKIWLTSTLGQGTTVYFTLPLKKG